MVVLVAFLQATEDGDGAGRIRLVYHHGLESAFQRLVLFKILLVFVQGGGTDASQLATRQGRFQDVRCIHGTFALSGTHQGVDLVDEENDVSVRFRYLVDYRLQAFLELALVLGTGHERTHVQREQLLVLQVLGHVSTEDALGETFHNGGLTGTRLTNQNRVVLGASAQDLEHTADFLIATYHRVELSVSGSFYQVDGILAQRLVGVLARLRSHVLSLAKLADGASEVFFVHACIF